MDVRFWGVRGSIAVSGQGTHRTGGNTTCVEVCSGEHRLVLDGGTGLPALGAELEGPVDMALLFSHVHWDHIQGVPFFRPLFHPGSTVRMVGARTAAGTVKDALSAQMRPPQFPITLDALRAELSYTDADPATPLRLGPFTVHTLALDHPDGVLAYRIEADGRSLVFATDVEHGETLDERLLRFAEGTDLLIHDAQYTDAEYRGEVGPVRRGWGHSSWEQAVDVARRAGAGRLALFHHDPLRSDDAVAILEDRARARLASAFAAREGLRVAV